MGCRAGGTNLYSLGAVAGWRGHQELCLRPIPRPYLHALAAPFDALWRAEQAAAEQERVRAVSARRSAGQRRRHAARRAQRAS
jgi:hypothetical protein